MIFLLATLLFQQLSDQLIEIDDGSQWKLENTVHWSEGDLLTISPNRSFFILQDKENYTITNQLKRESVKGELHKSPGQKSHYIAAINCKTGQIKLEDNTVWKVSRSTLYRLDTWKIGDPIIIGLNDSFWYADTDTIFINAISNTYTYVSCN